MKSVGHHDAPVGDINDRAKIMTFYKPIFHRVVLTAEYELT